AALWHGGISFGGVVSFVFADLIAMPLLLIYRKFYGGHLALRLLAVFWAVMAAAGLATEAIFTATGIVPTVRPLRVVPEHFSIDYTAVLNIMFLVVFAVLYWAYRNRERLGGGAGYAIDPVCGMQVERAHAPATDSYEGRRFFFCSDRCAERFAAEPAGFAGTKGPAVAATPMEADE
ncbi:MAG: YHS domain-containing protein, partial [Actinomycetota bacterium]|nr:YHS domain-containing protein [Actinomycetota bacterium]